jgi:hypothetical protein
MRWKGQMNNLKVNDKLMGETINAIKNRIIQKLNAARLLLDYDKEVAAGIYIYAVEELGKLEVIRKSKSNLVSNEGTINYQGEFKEHGVKFSLAKNYLVNDPECTNIGGSFSKKSFNGNSFAQELEVETEARLEVFYMDFNYDKNTDKVTAVKEIPYVNENKLRIAINKLEEIIRNRT